MAIINFGSINIDHVYQVPHFVKPGETLASTDYQQLLGGKGSNQSVALAQAGAKVRHVGRIAATDIKYREQMMAFGIDCRFVHTHPSPSGHAIIQVVPSGENSIFLFAGANQQLSHQDIDNALAQVDNGDWVLTQNETSKIDQVLIKAKEKGLQVAFNPAPMTASVQQLPLDCVDLLIVNEVEAAQLSQQTQLDAMQAYFREHMPTTEVIITLGKAGVCMLQAHRCIQVPAFTVSAVDTTAAGDTFIGYFLACYSQGGDAHRALQQGCAAAALAVTRAGAAQSIPSAQQVKDFLAKQ